MAINATAQQEAMKLQQEYQAANGDQAKIQAIQEAYAKLMTDAQAKETELIKANPDSYVSTFVIVSGMGQMEYEQLKEITYWVKKQKLAHKVKLLLLKSLN